jgi:2-keto-3-deoxy-L-fuconate dehydrogenase
LNVRKQVEFPIEEAPARVQLSGCWLVVRRRAVGSCGNPCVAQLEPVAGRPALRLRGQARPIERSIQEVPRPVPRKHPSRAIGPVGCRSEAENQQPRGRIAEGRHRLTPVVPVEKCAPLGCGNFPAVADQAHAPAACRDLAVQYGQPFPLRSIALRWIKGDAVTIHAMSTPFRLDGRTALVTGGASGIGEQTCRVLAEAGASVIVVDIDRAAAEKLAAELRGASYRIFDITDEAAVRDGVKGMETLDILVNNAGIGLVGGAEETETDDFDRIFRVNVRGLYLVTKFCLPLLRAAKGCIVNIGSVAGLVGVKRRFAYCGTKGAVVAMTRQLAVDYPTEIRVNCIAPGTVDTPFVEGYLEKYHKHEKDKVRAELNQRQPVGRLGRPVEIAYLALYLCSDQAAFVNGSVVAIDGGWTAA